MATKQPLRGNHFWILREPIAKDNSLDCSRKALQAFLVRYFSWFWLRYLWDLSLARKSCEYGSRLMMVKLLMSKEFLHFRSQSLLLAIDGWKKILMNPLMAGKSSQLPLLVMDGWKRVSASFYLASRGCNHCCLWSMVESRRRVSSIECGEVIITVVIDAWKEVCNQQDNDKIKSGHCRLRSMVESHLEIRLLLPISDLNRFCMWWMVAIEDISGAEWRV